MNFPIQSVPLPRQTQPFQQPKTYDPADVIMQAAHLNMQNEQLKQKQLEDLTGVLNTVSQLMEHRRHSQAEEAQAKALLDLHAKMQPAQMSELEAKTQFLKAQSNLFDNSTNISEMLKRETLPPSDPRAIPPGTTANSLPKFGLMRSALINAYSRNPEGNFSAGALRYFGEQKKIATEEGPSIQLRARNYSAVLPQLNTLAGMIKYLPQGDFQDLNSMINKVADKFGSDVSNAFKTQVSRVILTMRAASPNGTDAVLDQDMRQLSTAKSGKQLHHSIQLLFKDAVNQRNVILGSPDSTAMSNEEKSYNLYPSEEGFGGLGNIGQQDTSAGGNLVNWFTNLIGQQSSENVAPNVLGAVKAEKMRRGIK